MIKLFKSEFHNCNRIIFIENTSFHNFSIASIHLDNEEHNFRKKRGTFQKVSSTPASLRHLRSIKEEKFESLTRIRAKDFKQILFVHGRRLLGILSPNSTLKAHPYLRTSVFGSGKMRKQFRKRIIVNRLSVNDFC